MTFRILLADDEADHWQMTLAPFLAEDVAIDWECARTPAAFRSVLRRMRLDPSADRCDLILLDINFDDPDADGLTLLKETRLMTDFPPIVMLSGESDARTVVKARRLGARDFIDKHRHSLDEICLRIRTQLEEQTYALREKQNAAEAAAAVGAVCGAASMVKVFTQVSAIHQHPSVDVLIQGEPGTGKEVIADAIHWGRKDLPFVKVNCGALADSILESELFGYEKGAFTGADQKKKGLFEAAEGGDIFLDEIGCLSDSAQIALLRVLENRTIKPVGGSDERPINVRVIAATNENLRAMVVEGKFRKDLLSRLQSFEISLPPLRERLEDLPALVEFFLQRLSSSHRVDPLCLEILKSYRWPGNIRELRHTMQKLVINASTGHEKDIRVEHLPCEFMSDFEEQHESDHSLHRAKAPNSGQGMEIHFSIEHEVSLAEAKEIFLIEFIKAKRQFLGGKPTQEKLAKELDIPRSTLTRYLKKLHLNEPDAASNG